MAACAGWSLSLPSTYTTSIYGAMTATERLRARRSRDRAAAAEAEAARLAGLRGMPAVNAAKTVCKHGHDLSPGSSNVRVGKGRDGRPMRVCLACKRIRRHLAHTSKQQATSAAA